jgi:hypothetical protein
MARFANAISYPVFMIVVLALPAAAKYVPPYKKCHFPKSMWFGKCNYNGWIAAGGVIACIICASELCVPTIFALLI